MNNTKATSLRRLAIVLAICAISILAVPANSTMGDQDFTLVNKTGLTINELYVCANSSNDWGKDILGNGKLDTNRTRDIIFKPGTKAARWDIKIIDENGKEHIKTNINLLDTEEITVKPNSKDDDGWVWIMK